METHKIRIVVEHEEVRCIPNRQKVEPGDTVIWECEGAFIVFFGLRTPFTDELISGRHQSKGHIVKANASHAGRRLIFKYTAFVSIDDKVFFADPTVIIDP